MIEILVFNEHYIFNEHYKAHDKIDELFVFLEGVSWHRQQLWKVT